MKSNPFGKPTLRAFNGRTIKFSEVNLHSVPGAQRIITELCSGRPVTKLILGHNSLGDDGCVQLFNYLSSEEGGKHVIDEIALNSTGIGDVGLRSITRYLRGNETLKELFLQNNSFQGDAETILSFTSAINMSRLQTLVLTSNVSLSDSFISHFMPTLDSRHLTELHLSMLGLTRESTPYIEAYLSSSRSRPLAILKLNGNQLEFVSVRRMIRSLDQHNFTLSRLEIYSNGLFDQAASSDDESLFHTETCLRRIMTRNEHLKKETEIAAFELFRYARTILLRSSGLSSTNPQSLGPHTTGSLGSQASSQSRMETRFPFSNLPTELQLYVLSFIAPSLSTAQRLRIYKYASDSSTLPPSLPRLQDYYRSRTKSELGMLGINSPPMSLRDESRAKWLVAVGCNYYEAD